MVVDAMPDLIKKRREEILQVVDAQGFVTIEALAAHFDVSAQTVRRDIIELDAQGLLRRFHGGAGASENFERPSYSQKKALQSPAKIHIARKVAELIEDGSSLFIDVGTTAEAAATALKARNGLKVFAASYTAALIFAEHPTTMVEVAGGRLDGPDGALVGARTTRWLASLRIDYALIACSAIEPDGSVLDFSGDKIEVKRTAMSVARCSLLMADHSKFARRATYKLADLEDFDHLVIDRPPKSLALDRLEAKLPVIVCSP
jgi:DeoR family glycerol-3-phosphate regulon repressor